MVQAKQVRLGGSVLGRYRHVCAFFRNGVYMISWSMRHG